jgi:hypothetical protein
VEWGFDTENLRAESPDALVSRPAELLQEV